MSKPTRMSFGPGSFVKERPAINAKMQDLKSLTKKTLRLLEQANHGPEIFLYGRSIVRVERDNSGFPVLQVTGEGRMRQTLAEFLEWYQLDKDEERSPARPPHDLAKNILATPHDQIPFPILKRVTYRPVFTRDGSLIRTPGYDSGTGILYSPPRGFRLPPVSDRPTPEELGCAKQLILEELLGDFPLTDKAAIAHTVSAMWLPFVRELVKIKGPTPLYLIEKPTPGTGATLLAQMICKVGCGREPEAMTAPRDDAEWSRTLLAKLQEGPEFLLIDNVTRILDSAALASAITTTHMTGRLVGTSVPPQLEMENSVPPLS